MKFGMSTYAFRNETLTSTLLDQLRNEGFRTIELMMNRPHLDYRDRGLQKDLARWFATNDVEPPSLHLPFLERTSRGGVHPLSALSGNERDRREVLDEIKRALEFTDRTTVSHVVVHLGVERQAFNPLLFEYAESLLRCISEFAGVRILIENIPNEISTLERIREFRRVAARPEVGICYDSGHGWLQGRLPDLRGVDAIHLNDNGSDKDDHRWPFDGSVNWPEFAAELVRAGFRGPLIYEVSKLEPGRGKAVSEQIEDLLAEARSSVEEFRIKYALKSDRDDDELH